LILRVEMRICRGERAGTRLDEGRRAQFERVGFEVVAALGTTRFSSGVVIRERVRG
jgi:hypothetical protein